jgi:hypothetical protein
LKELKLIRTDFLRAQNLGWVQWCIPVDPAARRLRQEDHLIPGI